MSIKDELLLYWAYLKEVIKELFNPKPPFGHA